MKVYVPSRAANPLRQNQIATASTDAGIIAHPSPLLPIGGENSTKHSANTAPTAVSTAIDWSNEKLK